MLGHYFELVRATQSQQQRLTAAAGSLLPPAAAVLMPILLIPTKMLMEVQDLQPQCATCYRMQSAFSCSKSAPGRLNVAQVMWTKNSLCAVSVPSQRALHRIWLHARHHQKLYVPAGAPVILCVTIVATAGGRCSNAGHRSRLTNTTSTRMTRGREHSCEKCFVEEVR